MKTPFKILFSNDTTNLQNCRSPYAPGQNNLGLGRTFKPFTEAGIQGTVDETAGTGIDVHMLQPGLGWVPLWRSQVYPFAQHRQFMLDRFGMTPDCNGMAQFLAAGGDVVDVFIKRCREKKLAPFISLRLNDSHGHEWLDLPPEKIPGWAWIVLTPTHVEHPEWRMSRNLKDWNRRVLDWSRPEVRALKFAHIRELCENYDLDGFELDFMRHCKFFAEEKVPVEQRQQILTGFVRDVRALLDRTSKPGQHRWLTVRIPAHLVTHDEVGIDVRAFAAAGVDLFNLSYYFFTSQDGDLAAIRQLVPDRGVYVEMGHTTLTGASSTYDDFTYRRTTPHQFYTTAHLAYARGLDGVSTFNFVYYRDHGTGNRGPFSEPPFEIFPHLHDRDWLARQPQHYFLAAQWQQPVTRPVPLTKSSVPGQPRALQLDMAPPSGGWIKGGRLRIQAPASLGDSQWRAEFNSVELTATPDRSEPYSNPYPCMLGTPEQHRAWTLPAHVLQDGINKIELTLLNGDKPVPIVFVDVAVE